MSTARIQDNSQVTIPNAVRRQIGLSKGDLVDFSVKGNQIVMTPKVVIDRSRFETADDEYTPAQRRIINARLDKADEDIRAGRTYGPFDTADEMIKHIKGQLRKRIATKKSKRTR